MLVAAHEIAKEAECSGLLPSVPSEYIPQCFTESNQTKCEEGWGRSTRGVLQRTNDGHFPVTPSWIPLPPLSWYFPLGPYTQESQTFTVLTKSIPGRETLSAGASSQGLFHNQMFKTQTQRRASSGDVRRAHRWALLLSGTHMMFKNQKSSSSSGDVVSTFCFVSSALVFFLWAALLFSSIGLLHPRPYPLSRATVLTYSFVLGHGWLLQAWTHAAPEPMPESFT